MNPRSDARSVMRRGAIPGVGLCLATAFILGTSSAATLYVSLEGHLHVPPYTNWATAANTIQQAVDAASAGDEIIVTNGIYEHGGKAVQGLMMSRVAVYKPLTLRSVNGPQFTLIKGHQVPGITNGIGAIRCVYLTNGARLWGFTLTNGATRISGDWPDNLGGGVYCEDTNALIFNCVITGNSAAEGGGAYGGTLNNCTLTGNRANGTGGGVTQATLNGCLVAYNCAQSGGGAGWSTLNNCTVTGNAATQGGGAFGGTLNNCIIYYNRTDPKTGQGDANHLYSLLRYCCTTPLPGEGLGNISDDPRLASALRLSVTSPCRKAGSAEYTGGTDIDGEAWESPPSMGCDEYHGDGLVGPLTARLQASYTNVVAGFPVEFAAWIEGRVTVSRWELGDGSVVHNQPCITYAWEVPGDYKVVLRAYNQTYPEGVEDSATIHVLEKPIHYVAAGSVNPLAPYTSWATAAQSIQEAVDAVTVPGALVLVTNGEYATGGLAVQRNLMNRVAVTKPLVAVRSVNGPECTVIRGSKAPGGGNGSGAVRCVYLSKGATLSGFTLVNGATRTDGDWHREQSGGGVWCESGMEVISDCVLTGNSAFGPGGAAYQGTLQNCVLTDNSAGSGGAAANCMLNNCILAKNFARYGGGAWSCTLSNCTVTGNVGLYGGGALGCTLYSCLVNGNSARAGGGAQQSQLNGCALSSNTATESGGGVDGGLLNNCTLTANFADLFGGGACGAELNNCIVYFNSALSGDNFFSSLLNFSCTTPLPLTGEGNLSLDPQLASLSHLSWISPCRGAGRAAYATGVDLDGEAWLSPPSIGCDELKAGAITGEVNVVIGTPYTCATVGFPFRFTVTINSRLTASEWYVDGKRVATNCPLLMQTWNAPGQHKVVLKACNESYPQGHSATQVVDVVDQVVHFVSPVGGNVAPYSSWSTAARNIQDAVDAVTVPGSLVLVTNGTYTAGGRAVSRGSIMNRVAVDKALTLRSVNGPEFTLIVGGSDSTRCVYLTNGVRLSGFTLSKGATRSSLPQDDDREQCGGGVWCASLTVAVSNCVFSGNAAYRGGGAAYRGTLERCRLENNTARLGGGGYDTILKACTLTGNSAEYGGGAYGGSLTNCILSGNRASNEGGGAISSTLSDCVLSENVASSRGGGASSSLLHQCLLKDNAAAQCGGGAYQGWLSNCRLTGNTGQFGGGTFDTVLNSCAISGNCATDYGGGVYLGTLRNCTVTGNRAGYGGGGAYGANLLNNCVLYFNTAATGPNYADASLNYCCTTPLPGQGIGNIDADPQLVSACYLSSNSPCRGAGRFDYTTGTDIDGEPWENPPAIGCDEFHGGPRGGPLSASVAVSYTNVVAGYAVDLQAIIEGQPTANRWEMGDGMLQSNRLYFTYSWDTPGDYLVTLRAYNDDHPEGVSATQLIHVKARPTLYVAEKSAQPMPPYGSWATAATRIQDAVDATEWIKGPCLILVSNGLYASGGATVDRKITNRAALNRPLILQSVNGPQFTAIQGNGLLRCVYLAAGARLTGFTLANGTARSPQASESEQAGGGVWCESVASVVSDCVLTGNSAHYGAGAYGGTLIDCTVLSNSAFAYGGGTYGSTLSNCVLTGNAARFSGGASAQSSLQACRISSNSAQWGGGSDHSSLKNCTLSGNVALEGGGAYKGELLNCTVTGNSATVGGGVVGGTLYNCIVYYNTATNEPNYFQDSRAGPISWSCTQPCPANGIGNITNAPLFVDYSGGNLRADSNSPCINAGNSDFAPKPMDLDGNPRIVGGTVDVGAYEFQRAGSMISHAWLQQYNLSTDGSADLEDSDSDGMNNWQEWRCQTHPKSARSVLRLISAVRSGTACTITWESTVGVSYTVERSTNVLSSFVPVSRNIPGQVGSTSLTDKNLPGSLSLFYRVAVGQ